MGLKALSRGGERVFVERAEAARVIQANSSSV
jgi:hypothetical protein